MLNAPCIHYYIIKRLQSGNVKQNTIYVTNFPQIVENIEEKIN